MDNQQGPTVQPRELCSMLCGSLDGRGLWGRMDTCICVAESLPCSLETITTLLIGCTPIYSKKFNPSLLFETFSGCTSQRASPGPLLHLELGLFLSLAFLLLIPKILLAANAVVADQVAIHKILKHIGQVLTGTDLKGGGNFLPGHALAASG